MSHIDSNEAIALAGELTRDASDLSLTVDKLGLRELSSEQRVIANQTAIAILRNYNTLNGTEYGSIRVAIPFSANLFFPAQVDPSIDLYQIMNQYPG